MRDTHGTFDPFYGFVDTFKVKENQVAPEATSFTVTREWLEKIRAAGDAALGEDIEAAEFIHREVDALIGPEVPNRVLPMEVIADTYVEHDGGLPRGEIAMSLASSIVGDLSRAGYRIVEVSDGD